MVRRSAALFVRVSGQVVIEERHGLARSSADGVPEGFSVGAEVGRLEGLAGDEWVVEVRWIYWDAGRGHCVAECGVVVLVSVFGWGKLVQWRCS